MFKKVSSKEEMEKSYAIRTKVFCEEQKISKEIEFDNLDHLCSHFLIFDDKKEFRRLKVGSTLIKNIIQYFMNLNENISFILHSQVAVADFYESINFISYGDEFFEDGIPHIAMNYIIIKLSTFSLVNLLRPFPSEPSIKATLPVSFSSS